jgi:regulatory protein
LSEDVIDASWLERYTAWYLQRWSPSEERLRRVLLRKLRERGGDPELVEPELARLTRARLLDDGRLAESRARSRHRKGRSGARIREELRREGVAEEVVRAALEARSESPDPDFEAALAWARKRRLGPWRREPLDPTLRRRELASLARAGFPYAVASRVVDTPPEEP